MRRVDNALVLASEVANLRKPEGKDVSLLTKWLQDDELGGNFLSGTEALTWDARHKSDFVVLRGPPPDNEPLIPSLFSLPLDVFHRCRGNRVRSPSS